MKKEDANSQYMALLGALGAYIENSKTDIALARFEVERLTRQLEEANQEIERLKGENDAQ